MFSILSLGLFATTLVSGVLAVDAPLDLSLSYANVNDGQLILAANGNIPPEIVAQLGLGGPGASEVMVQQFREHVEGLGGEYEENEIDDILSPLLHLPAPQGDQVVGIEGTTFGYFGQFGIAIQLGQRNNRPIIFQLLREALRSFAQSLGARLFENNEPAVFFDLNEMGQDNGEGPSNSGNGNGGGGGSGELKIREHGALKTRGRSHVCPQNPPNIWRYVSETPAGKGTDWNHNFRWVYQCTP